jgi:hypothetical protein
MGFIYLIQLAKHKNINVYKVGMTEQLKLKDRLNGYGKLGIDYVVEYFMKVNGSKNIEEKILEIFNEHFILYEGREWFMGNCNEMINLIKDNYIDENTMRFDKDGNAYQYTNDDICRAIQEVTLAQREKFQSIKKYYKDESEKIWETEKSYNWWSGNHYDKSFYKDFTEAIQQALDGYDLLLYTGEGDWQINVAALRYRLDGYEKIKEI